MLLGLALRVLERDDDRLYRPIRALYFELYFRRVDIGRDHRFGHGRAAERIAVAATEVGVYGHTMLNPLPPVPGGAGSSSSRFA